MAATKRTRRGRAITYVVAALLITLFGGTIALRVFFNGEQLAATITDRVNRELKGRFEASSIEWPLSHIHVLVAGGWLPVTIRDLKMYDERGTLIISADLVTAELDALRLLSGFRHLALRRIRVSPGAYALLKTIRRPGRSVSTERKGTSLLSAFGPVSQPTVAAGLTPYPGMVVKLDDYEIKDATIDFQYEHFRGTAMGVDGSGYLHLDRRDPFAPSLSYSLAPTAKSAVTYHPFPMELTGLWVERLAQERAGENTGRDFEYKGVAVAAGGPVIAIDGRMVDHWLDPFLGSHDITANVFPATPLLERISRGYAHGNTSAAHFSVRGPVIDPVASTKLENIAVRIPGSKDGKAPGVDLAFARLEGLYDFSTDVGRIGDRCNSDGCETAAVLAADGQIDAKGTIDVRADTLSVSASVSKESSKRINLKPWLPLEWRRLAGGALASGTLLLTGDTDTQIIRPRSFRVGQTAIGGSFTHIGAGVLRANRVQLTRGQTRLYDIGGTIDLNTLGLKLNPIRVKSDDLDRWFRQFGLPTLAQRVEGTGKLDATTGLAKDVRARTTGDGILFSGVPWLDQVVADVELSYPMVRVTHAKSTALGGTVTGSGGINVGRNKALSELTLSGQQLDLARLPGLGHVLNGSADFRATASGPIDWPEARIKASLSDWSIAGDTYRDASVEIRATRGRQFSLSTAVERLRGGRAEVELGSVGDTLTGGAKLDGIPLRTFLSSVGANPTRAGGTLAGHVTFSGTTEAPTATGVLRARKSWFGRAFLGDADVRLNAVGDGLIEVGGSLFQGRIAFSGTLDTRFPVTTDLQFDLRRVDLDLLFPEIAQRFASRGWVSGTVRLKRSLFGGEMFLSADLNEAVVVVENYDAGGRPAPVRLVNKSPIRALYDGTTVTLPEPITLRGPTGDFQLWGQGSADALDFQTRGTVAVAPLTRYLERYFESMSGQIDVQARIAGSLTNPTYTGALSFNDVILQPQGQDATVAIPTGRIEIADDQLSITGLKASVTDVFSRESATIHIAGGARLNGIVPESWAIRIHGALGGKLLLVTLPSQLSQASGRANLTVSLYGRGRIPKIDATVDFDKTDPLKITPRGLRRDIEFQQGTIRVADNIVEFEGVRGRVDDEGEFTVDSGQIELDPNGLPLAWVARDVDILVSARDVPVRLPGELELSVNVPKLHIAGQDETGFRIEGAAEIIDGRYVRKWQPFLDAVRPERSTETSAPFYSGRPWLANADLQIDLAARSFFVKNNIANISLNGSVVITGTPKNPRFEGVIRVEQGSFKFQGIRAKFTRTRGTVTFSHLAKFPTETPYLRINSESDYRDINGQDHVVILTLEGPFASLDWDLSTSTGLSKGQTFTLIFAGRTPEEARRSLLNDQAIGTRPGAFSGNVSTAAEESTLVAVDQVVKDLAGDFFAVLIEDPIRNFTTLDVARLELGTASIGFRGEKSFTKSLRVIGEVDRSYLRGWSWDVRGEYRLTDSVSVDGEVLQKNYDDDAEEDETNLRAKISWRRVLLP